MKMTELIILMCECAAEGLEPIKAFGKCTKAGMVNVKRDEFEKKYAGLLMSPFTRVLETRTAREDDFKQLLSERCLMVEPTEGAVTELAIAHAKARQDPTAVLPCITSFRPLLGDEVADMLVVEYNKLWGGE